ncbi:MAG: dephospho-CoA kinase [Desulfobulbaceae bacterium]|nr:MAG: dephospho-CoA kinase [Desulfobulbaceae bacterium]
MKLAITGGIGSGKSSVAAVFAGLLRADLFSADQVCHQLMLPGASGWQGIVTVWGERFLNTDGTINRGILRDAVFRDETLRHRLETVLHPLIRSTLKDNMAAVDNRGGVSIVEVPLLYEVQWQDEFDAVTVVYAPEAVCIARVCGRDGLDAEEAGRIFQAQMPPEEKAARAAYVVDNSGLWAQTFLQVSRLVRLIGKNR